VDGLTLLRRAEQVGLRVEAAADQLKITGPKSAEPIVKLLAAHKPAVLRALQDASEGKQWLERYDVLTFRSSIGRSWSEARPIAWGALQNEWHEQHGRRWPIWQCAGCEKPIGGSPTLDLPDGNRVHLGPIDCPIRFGHAWRGAADAGLSAFGLEPPCNDQ